MTVQSGFAGFPRECVGFYTELASNNNREWFAEHKSQFDKFVTAPARDFVSEMGKLLKSGISSGIVADPRPDKSIFRYYRDTRFSKDKSSFKTHLGIFFWEGNRAKMECPGFYFHLEPPQLMVAAGIHCFSKPLLQAYRDAVVDPKSGDQLAKAVKAVLKKNDYEVGGIHYKKVPRGYDPNHKNSALLLHDGLYAAFTTGIPQELYSSDILDFVYKRFKDVSPVFEWLREMVGTIPR